MSDIYPGNGSCEICGQIDPCDICAGVPTAFLKLATKSIKGLKDYSVKNSLDTKKPPCDDKEKTA
jgi:hypothetical protein